MLFCPFSLAAISTGLTFSRVAIRTRDCRLLLQNYVYQVGVFAFSCLSHIYIQVDIQIHVQVHWFLLHEFLPWKHVLLGYPMLRVTLI